MSHRPMSIAMTALLLALLMVPWAQAGDAAPTEPGFRPAGVTLGADGTVSFTVTGDPGRGWPMWWMFRLDTLSPGQSVQLKIAKNSAVWPVVSENGTDWRHFHAGKPVTIAGTSATFAWYVPYLLADIEAMAAQVKGKEEIVRVSELCRSEQDHPVHIFEVGQPLSAKLPVIWVQARQHAWEVGSSWTAHGLLAWAAGDSPEARLLRSRATLLIVPIMDIDQVQRGNGGKNQEPHDHNQNWLGTHPKGIVYRSVQAAQERLAPLIATQRLALFLDLHDPSWGGPFEWWVAPLEAMSPELRARMQSLHDLLKRNSQASTPLHGFNIIAKDGRNARVWVDVQSDRRVVTGTLEIPVAPPKGFTAPPPAQHVQLGAGLGVSLAAWMAEAPAGR